MKKGILFTVLVCLLVTSISFCQWSRNAEHKGNITAVAVSPNYNSDNTLFIAVEGKGVLKSVNRGISWTAINSGLTTLDVTSLAVSWNGSGFDIYAGTKDEGIFASMEGSAWFEYDWGLTNVHVTSLVMSGQTLFAGTYGGGVFKSIDGGGTWETTNSPVSEIISIDAVFPGVSAPEIFAGTDGFGIIYSADGGDSWAQLSSGLPSGAAVRAIKVSPQFLSDGTVFAGLSSADDDSLTGLYESSDGGTSWNISCPSVFGTQVWSLSVEPTFTAGAGNVYIGSKSGLYVYEHGTACGLSSDSMLTHAWVLSQGISPDFGVTDSHIHFGLWDAGLRITDDGGTTSFQSYSTHTETNVKAIEISPRFHITDNVIVAATNDRGILRTLNEGLSWTTLNRYEYSGDPDSFISISVSPEFEIGSDITIFAGTAGRGLFKSVNGGNSWDKVFSGLPYGCTITAIALSPKYGTDETVFVGTRQYGLYKSLDGGGTWMAVSSLSMSGIFTLAFSPNFLNDNFLYATGTNGNTLYRSSDLGDSWQSFTVMGAASPYLISMAFSPRFAIDSTMFLGGNDTFGVFRSQTAGTEWENINGAGFPTGISGVRSVEVIPGYGGIGPERVYIGTYGQGVYFTDNAADTAQNVLWQSYNTGLEDTDVNDIEISPEYNSDGGFLYAATKTAGIFLAKHNSGQDWTKTDGNNTSLTDKIKDLAINPENESILLAGTGEGAYISLNGGETYIPYNRGMLTLGRLSRDIISVAFIPNPGNPPFPLAGTADGEIWRRADLVAFWVQVYTGSSAITEFSIVDGTVYASTDGGGVLKSVDNGISWSPVNSGLGLLNIADVSGLPAAKTVSSRSAVIGINPDLSDLSNPGGCCAGTVWVGTGGDGVSLSTDGGSSWSTANGGSLGEDLSGANCQAVLASTSGWAITGTDGLESAGYGMYRANDADETYWIRANYGLESTSLDIRDIVEAGNGDILCGIYGTTNGGVYLSADNGEHWYEINSGFDASSYSVEDVISTTSGTYYAGKSADGSWSTTVVADPAPTVTSLDVTTGSTQGGTSVTVTGTGFKSGAVVEFGDIDVTTTFVSSTSLTCTTPAYPACTVDVSVRNSDTRTGTLADGFTFTDPTTLIDLDISQDGTNVNLSWSSDGTGSYKIYRDSDPSFGGMFRETWDTTSTSYSDSETLTDTNVWFYKVE